MSASGVGILSSRLKERDLEVHALNQVIARQGRSLQEFTEGSIDAAVKRKELLLHAMQARGDKLELENEKLRDDLRREEHQRREADEKRKQAVAELHAHAVVQELNMAQPMKGVQGAEDHSQPAAVSTKADAAGGGENVDALTEELEQLKRKLTETQHDLATARNEAEAAKAKAAKAKATESLDSSQPPACESPACRGVGASEDSRRGVSGSLPSETYHALQSQRLELTKYVRLLEEKLSAHGRDPGQNARQRTSEAHTAMAERCFQVTKQLRVAETKVARATGLLEPTFNQLREAQGIVDELGSRSAQLEKELSREARLRVAAARMALTAHNGLHAAAASAAEMRVALAKASTASNANTYATPEEAAAAAAAQLRTLSSATMSMCEEIATCIAQTEALAPFTSSFELQPNAPPGVVEQLHLIADRPPPSLQPSKPRGADNMNQLSTLQQERDLALPPHLGESVDASGGTRRVPNFNTTLQPTSSGEACGIAGGYGNGGYAGSSSIGEGGPVKLVRVQSSPQMASYQRHVDKAKSKDSARRGSIEYVAMPSMKYPPPTPYVRSTHKAAPSPFVVQKPLQPFNGFVPRVEPLADSDQFRQAAALCAARSSASAVPVTDTDLSLQDPPQPPPSPVPVPGQLKSALAARGGEDADEDGAGVELEEAPLEGRRQDAMLVQPESLPSLVLPASQHAAVALSASSIPGFGQGIIYGELLAAPYTPSGQPLPALAGERRGWGQPASPQRIGAAMGTMMVRPTSRGGAGQPEATRGTCIKVCGQRPMSVRMEAHSQRHGAVLPGS